MKAHILAAMFVAAAMVSITPASAAGQAGAPDKTDAGAKREIRLESEVYAISFARRGG